MLQSWIDGHSLYLSDLLRWFGQGLQTTARTSLHKTNFSSVLDGRLVEKRKKPVPEGPAHADDGASPHAVAAFRVQALERSRGAAHGLL